MILFSQPDILILTHYEPARLGNANLHECVTEKKGVFLEPGLGSLADHWPLTPDLVTRYLMIQSHQPEPTLTFPMAGLQIYTQGRTLI